MTRRRRILLVLALALAGLAAALAVAPNLGLRYALRQGLAALGATRIELGHGDLSLFNQRLVLKQVLAGGADGGAARLGDLVLSFTLRPLFDRRVALGSVALSGVALDVVREPDGRFTVKGLVLPTVPASEAEGARWTFGIDDLTLTDSTLTLTDGPRRLEARIDRLRLKDLLDWQPDQPAAIDFAGTLAGAATTAKGTVKPFGAHLALDLALATEGLDLAALAPWLAIEAGRDYLGRLSATATLALGADAKGGLVLDLAGSVESRHAPHLDRAAWVGKAHLGPEGIRASGHLDLEQASLHQGERRIVLRRAAIAIGALDLALGPVPTGAFAGRVDLDDLHLADPAGTLRLGTLAWEGRVEKARPGTPILHQANLAASGLVAEAQGALLALDRLSGPLRLAQAPSGAVEAGGSLTASGLALDHPQARLTLAGLDLDLASANLDQGRLAGEGKLAARGLDLAGADASVQAETLSWQGALRGDHAIVVEGRLDLGRVQAALERPLALAYEQKGAGFEGIVRLGGDGAPEEIAGKGRLKGAAVRLAGDPPVELATLDDLAIEDVRYGPTGAKARRLWGRDLAFLARGDDPWRIELGRLALADLARDPQGALSLGEARLSDLRLRLVRDAGGLVGADWLPRAPSEPADAPTPALAIGRLVVEGKSALDFADTVPEEDVELTLSDLALEASGLSTDPKAAPAQIRLSGRPGEFGRLDLDLTLQPFAQPRRAAIQGRVKGLDLPGLSGYVGPALGVAVKTGRLDADLKGSLTGEAIEGTAGFAAANLFLEELEAKNSRLAKASGLPLDMALNLLRDGEDRIALSVPFAGSLDDPQFDLGEAIGQAMGGALRKTALATLKLAIPLWGLVDLAGEAIEEAQFGLKPLEFAPGETTLSDAQRASLDQLAALLAERPGVRLDLCGVALESEWPIVLAARQRREAEARSLMAGAVAALRKMAAPESATPPPDEESLRDLAAERARVAKRHLVQAGRIDPSRLFECHPKIESEPGAGPRLDIKL
ncbi:MAG: DUF748 domain-containing protein [Rhodospirillales bacterium]|nr:DUF748 domain-containing protein [Rhodospirillales bacterium]